MEPLKLNLFFFRHGNEERNTLDERERTLTPDGIEESRSVGRLIELAEGLTVGFHHGTRRSALSVLLALEPDLSEEEFERRLAQRTEAGTLRPMDALVYKSIEDGDFSRALSGAMKENRILEFLVAKSDDFRTRSAFDISNYSIIAADIARVVLRYISSFIALNGKYTGTEKALSRVCCAREFVYPCFRAKLIEVSEGVLARNKYVEWYENHVEGRPGGRTNVAIVSITSGGAGPLVSINDGYSRDEYAASTLESVIDYAEAAFERVRPGIYVIPFDRDDRVAIVRYSDGYGFIGGGVRPYESLAEALEREIVEELGASAADIARGVTMLEPTYSFVGSDGSGHSVRNTQFFAVKRLDRLGSLEFVEREKGARIEIVNSAFLLEHCMSVHSAFRGFIQTVIVPALERANYE